jgi:triacylglycerol lipase
VVVFLHGMFASAGVLRPMRERVGRLPGIRTAALSYLTGPGADELSTRLGTLLSELPASCSIHLVGHSMGGVVARYFAVKVGDPRVVSTIALASPFGGIRQLGALRFEGARDLDADSRVLREVRLTRPARPIPHLSIVAGSDALVSTPSAHALPDGEVVVLPGRGHNTVLFDDEAIAAVVRRVRELGPGNAAR